MIFNACRVYFHVSPDEAGWTWSPAQEYVVQLILFVKESPVNHFHGKHIGQGDDLHQRSPKWWKAHLQKWAPHNTFIHNFSFGSACQKHLSKSWSVSGCLCQLSKPWIFRNFVHNQNVHVKHVYLSNKEVPTVEGDLLVHATQDGWTSFQEMTYPET